MRAVAQNSNFGILALRVAWIRRHHAGIMAVLRPGCDPLLYCSKSNCAAKKPPSSLLLILLAFKASISKHWPRNKCPSPWWQMEEEKVREKGSCGHAALLTEWPTVAKTNYLKKQDPGRVYGSGLPITVRREGGKGGRGATVQKADHLHVSKS